MTSQVRAFSVFALKSADADSGIIEGTATSVSPDRLHDVVEPRGAVFTLPLPLLLHHNSHEPVGEVIAANVTDNGIDVRARIRKPEETTSETLKNRLAEAWDSVRTGLLRGLSVGFNPLETAPIRETGGIRYLAWRWLELSIVTIPAHEAATIAVVRSLDRLRGPVARLDASRVVFLDRDLRT